MLDPNIFNELLEDTKIGSTATPVLAIAELLEELTVGYGSIINSKMNKN